MKLIAPCYCGACSSCRPEDHIRYSCEGCRGNYPKHVFDRTVNGLCPSCADLVQCICCKGWYGPELLNDDRLCAGCGSNSEKVKK